MDTYRHFTKASKKLTNKRTQVRIYHTNIVSIHVVNDVLIPVVVIINKDISKCENSQL